MPYIQQTKREQLDPAIDEVLNVLRELESDDQDSNNTEGNINYIITRILKRIYPGDRYQQINDAMGILSSVQSEYYRKVAAPLEEQKCYENGDVD